MDVLVYNAGAGAWGNIEELSGADFEQSWRINAMGAFLASKQVIPSMKARKTGSIDASEPKNLDPNDIAHTAHHLATQPRSAWSFEVDVRPSQESW